MSPLAATAFALPPFGGKKALPRMLGPELPSINPPQMRIMAVVPVPMLPPPSATCWKAMLATAAHESKSDWICAKKSAGRKLLRATVEPVKKFWPVALVQPAPTMLHVTVPPAVPSVPEEPHLPPVVTKSSG